jgi:hypothetical protein
MEDTLKVGPLQVTLHRTVRVHPEDKSSLPPSLGHLPIYKVADYRENCPGNWEDDAVFVALHDKEALWMSFRSADPVAIMVGAGGVNALNGEKLGLKLETDAYMVHPPQPWLDGWKDKDGTVFQFVGTEYKKGEGLTVGEQLHKEECKTGGMGIAVFEAKDPAAIRAKVPTPREYSNYAGGAMLCCASAGGSYPQDDAYSMQQFASGDANLEAFYLSDSPVTCDFEMAEAAPVTKGIRTRGAPKAREMGVGKGGKINQKIYPDPHGLEVWKEAPTAAVAVYLVNSEDFSKITGLPMPPLPKAAEDYYGRWYGLKDEHLGDVQGTDFHEQEAVAEGSCPKK